MSVDLNLDNPDVWDTWSRDLRLPFMAGPTREFLEDDVVDYFKNVTAKRFDTHGADIGRWSPLRPATVAQRESEGFPGSSPINHKTGVLRRWMTGTTSPKADVSDDGYEVVYPGRAPNALTEEKLRYAETELVGDNNKPRSVNALFPEHADVLEDLLLDSIEDHWRGLGVL